MKKFSCVFFFTLLLITKDVFCTTANPQEKPCTPPCCEREKRTKRFIYFCALHEISCIYTCYVWCRHPDVPGSLIRLDCGNIERAPEIKCKRLGSGEYTYEGCMVVDPTETCPQDYSSICYTLCAYRLLEPYICTIYGDVLHRIRVLAPVFIILGT
ncbi:MAG: hypothetical protein N2517_00855 [Ignavibacteria bacterium]|nr:hypothetical protein [Ignavibacteria bacterium]